MSSNRDSLFLSSSVGRAQGSGVLRPVSPTPSLREPLATHPLLSPSPSTSPINSISDASTNVYTTATRYTPYTPKHRVASPATIGTTNHSFLSISPQQHRGDAATQLHMMNLKAAAQELGLEHGSLGWTILEKLASETDQRSEWDEIWAALTTGQAILLLPLEQNSENISVEFLKSHIVFCDEPLIPSPNGSIVPIITLSGLRGTLSGDTLIIRSTLHTSSKAFQKILSPTTRSATLSSFPPLSVTTYAYPSFTIGSSSPNVSQIPLPPRPSPPSKPPLPPRPGTAASVQTPVSSRIPNPFASLFGSKTPTSSTPSAVLPVSAPGNLPQHEAHDGPEHAIEVYAYTINKELHIHHLAKAINKGLRDEVKASLVPSRESGVSGWIVDMVVDWAEGTFFPFTKTKGGGEETYITNEFVFEADEISLIVQEFYNQVTDAVFEKNKSRSKHRISENQSSDFGASGSADEQVSLISSADDELTSSRENKRAPFHVDEEDAKAHQVLEQVEGTICDLFYDRLFMPCNSDDVSHDEALSSRIAALNLLDLSLGHLGVEVEASAQDDVHAVVKACGDTLTMLGSPSRRRPADKSALLVKAHKLLVDGLSKLPPVRLRPDDEEKHNDSNVTKGTDSDEKEMESIPPDKRVVPEENEVVSPGSGEILPLETGASSPIPSVSKPTPVSGDVILPLMIFSVVKSNPPHLLSHLLYIQRFRNQAVGGEEAYCLINLMAVGEFLENVDLAHLGLGGASEQVVSTAELSPISVIRSRGIGSVGGSPTTIGTTEPKVEGTMKLRGRVEQQVDAIAGSANKVLSGVVDTSFGVLRALLPGNPEENTGGSYTADPTTQELRPSFALLRKESGFSIANLAASLPGARPKSLGTQQLALIEGEGGQQMTEVSVRPASRAGDDARESSSDDSAESSGEESDEDMEEGYDTRSIKSFESMMSERKKQRKKLIPSRRKTLADRLASVPGLARLSSSHDNKDSPPTSRRSSLGQPSPAAPTVIPGAATATSPSSELPVPRKRKVLPAPDTAPTLEWRRLGPRYPSLTIDTPASSRDPSPITIRIGPPIQRFLECNEDDLKVSEVRELLHDYRRIVEGVRAIGGFQE